MPRPLSPRISTPGPSDARDCSARQNAERFPQEYHDQTRAGAHEVGLDEVEFAELQRTEAAFCEIEFALRTAEDDARAALLVAYRARRQEFRAARGRMEVRG